MTWPCRTPSRHRGKNVATRGVTLEPMARLRPSREPWKAMSPVRHRTKPACGSLAGKSQISMEAGHEHKNSNGSSGHVYRTPRRPNPSMIGAGRWEYRGGRGGERAHHQLAISKKSHTQRGQRERPQSGGLHRCAMARQSKSSRSRPSDNLCVTERKADVVARRCLHGPVLHR